MTTDESMDSVYRLLAEHNVDPDVNVPDELKCIKCAKLLNNAHQGPCGCRLCLNCLNGLTATGTRICCGNTDDCLESLLSAFHTDFSINKKIAKVVVKCPEEMCGFKDELVNIYEHLRVCPHKSVNCVFYRLGCHEDRLAVSAMNEHLQSENARHMGMLMGVIDNIGNEVGRLKDSDMRKTNEIELLTQSEIRDRNEIDTLSQCDSRYRNETEVLKEDLVMLRGRIDCLEEEIRVLRVILCDMTDIPTVSQSTNQRLPSQMVPKTPECQSRNETTVNVWVNGNRFSSCYLIVKNDFRDKKLIIYKMNFAKQLRILMRN